MLEVDILMAEQHNPNSIVFWRQAREAGLQKPMIGNGGGLNVGDFAGWRVKGYLEHRHIGLHQF